MEKMREDIKINEYYYFKSNLIVKIVNITEDKILMEDLKTNDLIQIDNKPKVELNEIYLNDEIISVMGFNNKEVCDNVFFYTNMTSPFTIIFSFIFKKYLITLNTKAKFLNKKLIVEHSSPISLLLEKFDLNTQDEIKTTTLSSINDLISFLSFYDSAFDAKIIKDITEIGLKQF